MHFELTDEQRSLQLEIRSYLEEKITDELLEEIRTNPYGPIWREYIRTLGKDGWLGIGWPKEYGGQGKTPLEQYIFLEEITRTGITIPFITLETVGPTIMRFGTEEQKKEFLPKILRGELEVAIGYTEPEAGTDLASLDTRAVRDGDQYVINGQKVFTTNASISDYIWLAARTDPDAPKHEGISIFLVPTDSTGVTITTTKLMGEKSVGSSSTFYDNVTIPASNIIGEENKGWKYITEQLSLERLMLSTYSMMERVVEETTEWAKEAVVDGGSVIDRPWVQDKLANLKVKIEVLRLLNYRAAWSHGNLSEPPFRPSMNKTFAAELNQEVYDTCMQIIGLASQLDDNSKYSILEGKLEQFSQSYLVYLFGGGANEVQRDLVARFGLGIKRS